jgi:hypothetical protein
MRTGGEADIVEGQLGDPGVELQEKRQWLANTTSGTENGDLGSLYHMTLVSIYSENSQLHFIAMPTHPQQKQLEFGMERTWRADELKVRREAWEKACLAANMMTAIGRGCDVGSVVGMAKGSCGTRFCSSYLSGEKH